MARGEAAVSAPKTWRSARTAEERGGLLTAAAELGNVTVAAEALDVSRQHMHRLLRKRNSRLADRDAITVTLSLERALVEWLDLEAIRLKHRSRASKPSKSEVVTELIRQAMKERP